MSEEKSKKESLNNSQNEPKEVLIGDYIIKKTIGTGTFSTVKLGVHRITQKKVAVKILDKNKIESKDDLERIIREMQILTEMDHQNVIKIFKIYEEEDNFSIIMEYCEGGELFNYIVKKQRLSEDETCFFFYQIINGIEYIHSKGIAHRDLKPENLLIGKNKILKIIDFGLSNFYDGQKRLETPCGSPCYASPEMVKGKKYDGFNIDIWAIGVILFAMLCGYLPFEDDENDNDILFSQIIKNKIDYPSFLSELSLDMLKKILVSDPLKRITVDEIKKHDFYLKGEKIYNERFRKVEEINNKEKNNGILDKIAKAFKSEDDSDKDIIPITFNEKKAEKKNR
jgi:5'-AMP-activated protein kinase catalytic alpha subunit